MDILQQTISQMDRHAVRQFKIFSSRLQNEGERKDFYLFDAIRKEGEEWNEQKTFTKLYTDRDKNAFYRLKNRLFNNIGESVFLQQYTEDDMMSGLYYASLGYYYYTVNAHKIALYYFKKAEQKAKQVENYGLLDIIYSHMIKLAREIVSINPESYIKKRKENRVILTRLSEVEDILEAMEYRVKITQNLTGRGSAKAIDELLQKTLNEYALDDELKESPKVQFGLYFIISRTLLQENDYPALEQYLIATFHNFSSRNLFNKSNHKHKLQMLTWIANAAFANRKYQLSLEYAQRLKDEMDAFDGLHYDQFEVFYYNIQIINFSEINPAKAVKLLEDLTRKKFLDRHPYYGIFIFMNLGILHFSLKQYKKVMGYLNRLYAYESFQNADPQLKVGANIGELMTRFEMQEYDFLDYRLKQVQKDNKEILEEPRMLKEKLFLQFFEKLAADPQIQRRATFRTEIREYLQNFQNEWNSQEVLFRYNEWLRQMAN